MGVIQRFERAVNRALGVDNPAPAVTTRVPAVSQVLPIPIPVLMEARGVEQCFRCGQRAVHDQLIYAYRGMHFGGDCIGRVLILERENPGIQDAALQEELVRDMKRFRALGMARAARRMMRDNS
jgi:hypothetical protein